MLLKGSLASCIIPVSCYQSKMGGGGGGGGGGGEQEEKSTPNTHTHTKSKTTWISQQGSVKWHRNKPNIWFSPSSNFNCAIKKILGGRKIERKKEKKKKREQLHSKSYYTVTIYSSGLVNCIHCHERIKCASLR